MSIALITAALLACSGMFGLCLGLERHHRQLLQRPPRPTVLRALRTLGWLALAASFASCVTSWGWAMGPVGWFGLVSLTGLALVMLSPYVMRWLIATLFIGWLVVGLLTLV